MRTNTLTIRTQVLSHQNTVFHQLLKPILRQDFEAPDQAVLAQIVALKQMYGIQKHSLELLLNHQWDQQNIGEKC